MNIGEARVGEGAPCYVVAEVGANHDRDLALAERLIDEAAAAGVQAVKFQTYTGTGLYAADTPRFDYLGDLGDRAAADLLDDIALPREWQPRLADRCRARDVEFLSSPFDRAAIEELDALDVAAFKVASFEIGDLDLLRSIGEKGRPVIVSTGMATLGEIEQAVVTLTAAGAGDICLLQCASLYPAPPATMNLRAIPAMKAAFGFPVGLSDHTLGIHVAVAAVAIGADLIEKHVTTDRSRPGPDHPFAIEIPELVDLVSQVRDVESALGDGRKRGPSTEEAAEMFTKARRSLVTTRPIAVGEEIRREALTAKRPGHGIAPAMIDAVVGRRARRAVAADHVVTWDDV